MCCQCHAASTPTVASISLYIRSRAQPHFLFQMTVASRVCLVLFGPRSWVGIEACGKRVMIACDVDSGVEN